MNNLSSNALKLLQIWRKCKPASFMRFSSIEIDGIDNLVENQTIQHKAEKCVNDVRLIGRVGTDPVMETHNGKKYAKFPLATNVSYKSSEGAGEFKERTDWHNVVTHNPYLINYIGSYMKKGQRVYVSGRLSYLIPEKNQSGKHAFIALEDIVFLST